LNEILSVAHRRISDDIFSKLRDAIIQGKLPEGYVFPNENDLCKKLGIGRSTLREAYAPLEAMNLISRTKNGTSVNRAGEMMNSMNFDVIARYTSPRKIIEFRKIIEIGVVRLAAQCATDSDIQRLTDANNSMKRNLAHSSDLPSLDFRFHNTLAEITGNELLCIALNSIRVSYERFASYVFERFSLARSTGDHGAVIEAIRRNDPDAAEDHMRKHLEHLEKVIATGEYEKGERE
jgi:DNA-binding FadR family transcriptional regulator